MPLHDHFHPPLSERRPWESFHTTWASALADYLNEEVLPPGFIALEQVHAGAGVEIDVATFGETATSTRPQAEGGVATAARTLWKPEAASILLPAEFPPSCTVEILATDGGRTLAAAIELVSPGNKNREAKRSLFAAKCATWLSRGVGLIVVDVVTSRRDNLHHELLDLLRLEGIPRMPREQMLYAVAYRPVSNAGVGQIETWPVPLRVGEVLPTLPLSLGAECCLPVDLEAAYAEACRRRRVDDVAE
jgi:hypothetical protein